MLYIFLTNEYFLCNNITLIVSGKNCSKTKVKCLFPKVGRCCAVFTFQENERDVCVL